MFFTALRRAKFFILNITCVASVSTRVIARKYYSFLLSSQVSRQTRAKTLATQAILYILTEKLCRKFSNANEFHPIRGANDLLPTLKSDKSNQNRKRCFFTCEKNDTLNQKPQRCVNIPLAGACRVQRPPPPPAGVFLGNLGRGVPPGSPNPDPISDQKM